jgi:hypothetical protein
MQISERDTREKKKVFESWTWTLRRMNLDFFQVQE